MRIFNCRECSASIKVPTEYRQPFIQCPECGSHEKIPLKSEQDLKFKILSDEQRAHLELSSDSQPGRTFSSAPAEEAPTHKRTGPKIAAPALAPKKTAAGWPAKPITYKDLTKPVDPRQILLDALGKQGLEMLFQLVSSYLTESETERYRQKRSRVIQRMMKFGLSGELASQAVLFAEKSPETRKILVSAYKSNLFTGLGIFVAGILISTMVHLLANPGRGFVLFQIPFAVGFAFAANAALNMLAMKFPVFQSDKIHFASIIFFTLLIVAYIVWGFYF